MTLGNVRLILGREIRDQLRDRRTLFMIAVLPILLYPLLGISLLQVSQFMQEQATRVLVVGAKRLLQNSPLPQAVEGSGVRAASTATASKNLPLSRRCSKMGSSPGSCSAIRAGRGCSNCILPPRNRPRPARRRPTFERKLMLRWQRASTRRRSISRPTSPAGWKPSARRFAARRGTARRAGSATRRPSGWKSPVPKSSTVRPTRNPSSPSPGSRACCSAGTSRSAKTTSYRAACPGSRRGRSWSAAPTWPTRRIAGHRSGPESCPSSCSSGR